MQLEKLHSRGNINNFIEKVITKYNSKEYKKRWYGRGIESEEYLYFFLLKYAKKFGRHCTNVEYDKYGNEFTSDLYYCDGYFFNLMDGQGSCVLITKE